MQWKEYSKKITKVIGLKGSPVAITYSMEQAKKASKGKYRVCNAMLAARDGKIIDLTVKNSTCGGGTRHL